MKTQSVLAALLFAAFSMAAHADSFPADYFVPFPGDLSADAHFEIQAVTLNETAAGLVLNYRLPDDLVGAAPLAIELTGVENGNGQYSLTGPLANGSCVKSAVSFSCDVNYTGIDFQSLGTEAVLQKKFAADPIKLAKKLQVAKTLAGDMRGVIILDLSRSSGSGVPKTVINVIGESKPRDF